MEVTPLEKFKTRYDAFSDAIFAILITIMVLELPIELVNGHIDVQLLWRGVFIYGVSFCVVGAFWYRHALAFNQLETAPNKIILMDFFQMLAVSLLPAFTKLMIVDLSSVTVTTYAIGYMVAMVLQWPVNKYVANQRCDGRASVRKLLERGDVHRIFVAVVILAGVILLSWFAPRIAIVLMVAVPVWQFLQNANKQQDISDLRHIRDRGVEEFMRLTPQQRHEFARLARRYLEESGNLEGATTGRLDARSRFLNDESREVGLDGEKALSWIDDATERYAAAEGYSSAA